MKQYKYHFEITDIVFNITKFGNIKPRFIFSGVGAEMFAYFADLPNLYALQTSGLMIGDVFTANHIEDFDIFYGVDRSPPILPTHCPCCGEELSIEYGRHTVIKCLNTMGCSAQNQ